MKKIISSVFASCCAGIASAAVVSDVHSLWIKDVTNAGDLNGWANVGGISVPTDGSAYVAINTGATNTQRFTYDTAINNNIILEVKLAAGEAITTPAPQSTFLSLGSDTSFRRKYNTPTAQGTIWGPSGSASQDLAPLTNLSGSHLAIVYDQTNSTVTWYINKTAVWNSVLQPASGTAKIGVGGDVHSDANKNGIGIAIEGFSYATFNGTFNPTTDFQLTQVPEPSTYALIAGGLALGIAVVARRRKQK